MTGGDRYADGGYTVPTGDGYVGVLQVKTDQTCPVNISTLPVDWALDDVVAFTDRGGDRVGVVGDATPDEDVLTTTQVRGRFDKPRFSLPTDATRHLGVASGEDVRLYDRGAPGVTVVASADDPFVDDDLDDDLYADGGKEPTVEDSEPLARLLENVEIPDGWSTRFDGKTLKFDYDAAPLAQLDRRATPGIEANYLGSMYMLLSHDSIGHGLGIEHQGILNHGKSVDCQHFDDAVAAVEHGMQRVEQSVQEELDDEDGDPWSDEDAEVVVEVHDDGGDSA